MTYNCAICNDVNILTSCKFCSKFHCAKYVLPEIHNCSELATYKERKLKQVSKGESPIMYIEDYEELAKLSKNNKFKSHKHEKTNYYNYGRKRKLKRFIFIILLIILIAFLIFYYLQKSKNFFF